jgi:REP element-mobilizing transposase RayT
MPRRAPIDPVGTYHVGSRGCYGRTLFHDFTEHEIFLQMYDRVARKYEWVTLAWVLMKNHHHFIVELHDGGLSEGMRELHGGYSRWLHEIHGLTRQGHLFRHGFFARSLASDADVITACTYVDLNPVKRRPRSDLQAPTWSGFRATIGLTHARRFHQPSALLELFGSDPPAARTAYQEHVEAELVRTRQVLRQTTGCDARVVESQA